MRFLATIYLASAAVIFDLAVFEDARAQDIFDLENTRIVSISASPPRAHLLQDLRIGGYELANGDLQTFEDWYRPTSPSVYINGLTEIAENLALDWGLSTGMYGDKFEIDPALRIGFRYRRPLSERTDMFFSAFGMIGGDMSEKPCSANYGDIGGVQNVNCRLAASHLPPDETLDYLIDEDQTIFGISIEWKARF